MGQETIFETAIRECQEEASVKIMLTGLLGCYIHQKKEKINTIIAFTAKIIEGTPCIANKNEQLLRNENISKLEWFSKKEILKMKNEKFISDIIYFIIQDWIKGYCHPLDVIKQIKI